MRLYARHMYGISVSMSAVSSAHTPRDGVHGWLSHLENAQMIE